VPLEAILETELYIVPPPLLEQKGCEKQRYLLFIHHGLLRIDL